jgi:hypothetical protein
MTWPLWGWEAGGCWAGGVVCAWLRRVTKAKTNINAMLVKIRGFPPLPQKQRRGKDGAPSVVAMVGR